MLCVVGSSIAYQILMAFDCSASPKCSTKGEGTAAGVGSVCAHSARREARRSQGHGGGQNSVSEEARRPTAVNNQGKKAAKKAKKTIPKSPMSVSKERRRSRASKAAFCIHKNVIRLLAAVAYRNIKFLIFPVAPNFLFVAEGEQGENLPCVRVYRWQNR